MEAISTFGSTIDTDEYHVKSFDFYSDSEFENHYDFSDDVVSNWAPGYDIYVRLELSGTIEKDKCVVLNWYCPETHNRGAIRETEVDNDHSVVRLTGEIDGNLIRKKLNVRVQLLNSKGYISSTFFSQNIILEGKRSYFPIGILDFEPKFKNALCSIDMSIDTDPEDLFSQTVCRAKINRQSGFYNRKEDKICSYMSGALFLKYEMWRQKLEIALNNENFTNFIESESNDDIRIGTIWSNLLIEIFSGLSLVQIRSLRKNDYASFCSAIQSYFFQNNKGFM